MDLEKFRPRSFKEVTNWTNVQQEGEIEGMPTSRNRTFERKDFEQHIMGKNTSEASCVNQSLTWNFDFGAPQPSFHRRIPSGLRLLPRQ